MVSVAKSARNFLLYVLCRRGGILRRSYGATDHQEVGAVAEGAGRRGHAFLILRRAAGAGRPLNTARNASVASLAMCGVTTTWSR